MTKPRVLVVIPSLGQRPGMLGEALRSAHELGSILPSRTVVVLPQGARAAREECLRWNVEVIDDAGAGLASATNAGLLSRNGEEYFVWLGDDDIIVPAGVSALIAALDAHPVDVVAYGNCDYINEAGSVGFTNASGPLARLLLLWGPNLIPHPGTVIRLDALEMVGRYQEHLSYALDLDVFLSLRYLGKFVYKPVTASQFRWHADSLTVASRQQSNAEALRVRLSHMARWLRPLGQVWLRAVGMATSLAAHQVNKRFRRLA